MSQICTGEMGSRTGPPKGSRPMLPTVHRPNVNFLFLSGAKSGIFLPFAKIRWDAECHRMREKSKKQSKTDDRTGGEKLIDAIKANDLAEVQRLIADGADLNE